jgi:phage gpG-like protein
MQTVDEDRDYFGFSDDKVKEILRKIKEIFSKL